MTQRNITEALNQLNSISGEEDTRLMENIDTLSSQLTRLSADIWGNISQFQIKLYAIPDDIISYINCGGGSWYRVAYLNMSDSSQNCPSSWMLYTANEIRACGRPYSTVGSCPSTFFIANVQYSRVCGRIIGYQAASPDSFASYLSIDEMYIDGISIIGMPRNHIWSYAVGVTEMRSRHRLDNCPCSPEAGALPPSFIGERYNYCESSNPTSNALTHGEVYSNDPIWDGQQCEGTCCTGANSPPWFSIQLPAPTSNTTEVRICCDESTDNENTLIKLLLIYVQ